MGTLLVIIVIMIAFYSLTWAVITGLTMTTIWAWSEVSKKFGFETAHFKASPHLTFKYSWAGSSQSELIPRDMRKLVIHTTPGASIKIGFRRQLAWGQDWTFHVFGQLVADEHGRIVFTTYLGRGATDFLFESNEPVNGDHVTSTEDDQCLPSMKTYKPHWYQEYLGIFG